MVQPIILIENHKFFAAHIGRDGLVKDKRPAKIHRSNSYMRFVDEHTFRLVCLPQNWCVLSVETHNSPQVHCDVRFTEYGFGDVYTPESKYLGQIRVVWDAETPTQHEYEEINKQQREAAQLIRRTQIERIQRITTETAELITRSAAEIAEKLIVDNPKKARRFVSGRNVYGFYEAMDCVPEFAALNIYEKQNVTFEVYRTYPRFTQDLKNVMGDLIAQRYAKKRQTVFA